MWTQDSEDIADVAETRDVFGAALECGDFNNDGYDDLVIAAPGEALTAGQQVGVIHVLFGSDSGLIATDSQYLHRDIDGVNGLGAEGDGFGSSLAVGDFNADEFDDLAVGVPGDQVRGEIGAGSFQVFYGFDGGLSKSSDKIWHRGKKGVKGSLNDAPRFGGSLASGDFDGDGYDDLAIGSPDDRVGSFNGAGSVSVLYGTPSGLAKSRNEIFNRQSRGIAGHPAVQDAFGFSLSAGDFDGDGYDELAVGVPFDDPGEIVNAGSLHVLVGGEDGLTGIASTKWHRGKPKVEGTNAANVYFGSSLTTGMFDSGTKEDLAVGVHRDRPGGDSSAGSVHIFYGSSTGLAKKDDQVWHQGTRGITGTNNESDRFGFSLSAGDFNANGKDDLVIGVPYEDGPTTSSSGRVVAIYGRGDGLAAKGDQSWSQGSTGIEGTPEAWDQMGSSLGGSRR